MTPMQPHEALLDLTAGATGQRSRLAGPVHMLRQETVMEMDRRCGTTASPGGKMAWTRKQTALRPIGTACA